MKRLFMSDRLLFLSTAAFGSSRDLETVLAAYHAAGIDGVELGAVHEYTSNNVQLLKAYPDTQFIIHNNFPPPPEIFIFNLASGDATIRQRSIEQCKKAIDLAVLIQSPLCSFHMGFRVDPTQLGMPLSTARIATYDDAYARFVESFSQVVSYSAQKGIPVAIENNVLAKFNLVNGQNKLLLGCEAWEFENLLQDVPGDNWGILLDLGHLNVTANTLRFDKYDFISRVQDCVFCLHFHENDGQTDQHLKLSDGSWMFSVLNDPQFRTLPRVCETSGLTVTDLRPYCEWLLSKLV
jgi:sugar phosphate isomerase/epimerase